MDSLTKMRRQRQFGLAAALVLLAGLLAYSVLRPDPEEKEFQRLKGIVLTDNPHDDNSRREFREAMARLSPETQKRLMREVMREQLHRAREEAQSWSEEQKTARIDELILDVRKNFAKLTGDEREEIRKNFQSDEGKERLRNSLDFYYQEFTAEERKTLDPLVGEFLAHLDAL
ncbi:MAG: hypothetical protein RBS99_18475 [Rhodospirillales bacterium]|nr:hypothetical protein [Rhodospirillales bacterium]